MAKMRVTISIWEEEGVYGAGCRELEVASCWDSPQEAMDNIHDAIELYLENAGTLGIIEDLEPALTSQHKSTSVIEIEG
ncbi:MAG: type II toxin-antitoxin system HicB family antitoxin [Methanogenium sp.]|nr:type II toxin-antitoxin system HicB family antitoxin [Methanogenium sp.]